jgi:hypothetical protein
MSQRHCGSLIALGRFRRNRGSIRDVKEYSSGDISCRTTGSQKPDLSRF